MINDLSWQKVLVSTALEKDQRLSRSLLWRLQSAFYRQSGITAWNAGSVPHYITNNPYIAGTYAQVVQAFLRDRSPLDFSQPVYILELGAGSGRFAYHFLNRFLPSIADTALSGVRFVYLLTDLAERNLAFWRQHPNLQPYLESGQLEMATFDPLHEGEIHLACSGKTLTPADVANPLVVLANYFFDSLPADLFSIHNSLLCEELVTLTSPNADNAVLDPGIVPSLEITFHPRFAPGQYYGDPDFDCILQSYLTRLDGSYLLFPLGALETLRSLLRFSNGRMLFLTADKGEYRLEDLRRPSLPEIARHYCAISMAVNFHVLRAFTERQGGRVLQSKQREDGLVISAFLTGAGQNNDRETGRVFSQTIAQAGPDDFFMLKKTIEPYYASATLDQLLAFLRFSGDDPSVFSQMYPVLLERVQSADLYQQERLFDAACRVWELFYPIGEPFNLQLALAKLFIALACYPEALKCLRSSQQFYGADDETDTLIAQCKRYVWEE